MSGAGQRSKFVRLFSSAVFDQALLSLGSLFVGLVLVRHTSDHDYGYYVLAANALLLLVSLQNAFIGPPMVVRMARLDEPGKAALTAGLHAEQSRLLTVVVACAAPLVLLLWALQLLTATTAGLVLAVMLTTLALLRREYARMVLLAHRRPNTVLRGDVPYVLLWVLGAGLATLTPAPAVVAVLGMGLAALFASRLLLQPLRTAEGWDESRQTRWLLEIAPLSLWSAAGAAVHWTFSQGYSYLVAGVLDVAAVAAIAATRLTMMPVNLLATGIRSLMLPMTADWLQRLGAPQVLRRLLAIGLALGVAALCYFGVMWWLRDWIFDDLMQKQFADRDRLLLLWAGIFLLMVIRDMLISLLAARERFRALLVLTLASAALSLGISYWGMQHWGAAGALVGMLCGEIFNLSGVILLALREPAFLPSAPDEGVPDGAAARPV